MNDANTPGSSADPQAMPSCEVLTPRGRREHRAASALRPHDFRQSGFLTPSELRRIRLRHEQFIRSLAARLAIFLRLELTVQLSKVQIAGYEEFTQSLTSQTHITLFRIDPLKGVGLLVIPPPLCLGLVDRLLGGPGKAPEAARDLSEIEIALTDQVTTLLLSEWCHHWPEVPGLQPVLLGHENNSRFLQASSADSAMLVLTLDTGIGEAIEPVQLAFPYSLVEPLMRHLAPALPESDTTPVPAGKIVWKPEFDDLKVGLSAQWEGLKISAAQVAQLKPGDVLMLDPGCASEVEVRLSHAPRFRGRPGMSASKWAIQLTTLLPA